MEASYYTKLDNSRVRCELCPNRCSIPAGGSGICRIRVNRDGTLVAEGYGEVVSLAMDPIEKKPLYHFHPGRRILSSGANGCNLSCAFCQNHQISQSTVPTHRVDPVTLAETALQEDSIGVAYTYTEPFVWWEYIRDAGLAVRERGMVNVLITNGYVNEQPLRDILPLVDAMNIDVKSMNDEFYRKHCGGRLADVLRTVEIAQEFCHVEITNLVITGYNDSDDDFHRLTDWLAGVNSKIPLHFSRYFPRYLFTAPQTPVERLRRAYDIARQKLDYVYVGNIDIPGSSDTFCPRCGARLVARHYYSFALEGIENGSCASCGATVDMVSV